MPDEVTLDRYHDVLAGLRDAAIGDRGPGYGLALERAVFAANDLLGDHASIRNRTVTATQSIVIVIPLPVAVTPLAKLCSQLDKIRKGAMLRIVQPNEQCSIHLDTGDMLCDLGAE